MPLGSLLMKVASEWPQPPNGLVSPVKTSASGPCAPGGGGRAVVEVGARVAGALDAVRGRRVVGGRVRAAEQPRGRGVQVEAWHLVDGVVVEGEVDARAQRELVRAVARVRGQERGLASWADEQDVDVDRALVSEAVQRDRRLLDVRLETLDVDRRGVGEGVALRAGPRRDGERERVGEGVGSRGRGGEQERGCGC